MNEYISIYIHRWIHKNIFTYSYMIIGISWFHSESLIFYRQRPRPHSRWNMGLLAHAHTHSSSDRKHNTHCVLRHTQCCIFFVIAPHTHSGSERQMTQIQPLETCDWSYVTHSWLEPRKKILMTYPYDFRERKIKSTNTCTTHTCLVVCNSFVTGIMCRDMSYCAMTRAWLISRSWLVVCNSFVTCCMCVSCDVTYTWHTSRSWLVVCNSFVTCRMHVS